MTNKKYIIGGIFWGCIAAIVVGNLITNHKAANAENAITESENTHIDSVSYSDAVTAIMNSDMYGLIKQQTIALLGTDMGEDVYKSIIRVAEDKEMLAAYKRDTIRQICERYREKNIGYNERM